MIRHRVVMAATSFAVVAAGLVPLASPAAAAVPTGFVAEAVLGGLVNPTNVEFSPDGRVLVAEKSGLIKVFDSLADATPTVLADLRTQVHNFWDRGLLGMALAPDFPTDPRVYVQYTYDHELGSTAAAPRWGSPGGTDDGCPNPPGATADGCLVSGRLSELTISGNIATAERVLVEDWCQQFPSHSIGSIAFGADGALYASGGDGASFSYADYGQTNNPCGDPPGPAGSDLTAPTGEGGALRSQDLRTTADPVTLDGTVIRIDPDTGAGVAANPLSSSSDPNARRVLASGLRNPFRLTMRPGTNEVWLGDVGWNAWEEINRVVAPTGNPTNLGWPCYEGSGRQGGYDSVDLNVCESLYAAGSTAVAAPYYSYAHDTSIVSGDGCPTGSCRCRG